MSCCGDKKPLTKIRRFDRGDHTLVIDVLNGKKWKEPKSGPGTLQKAANFTKAAVKHVRSGRKKVSLEVIQERYAVCRDCPSGLFVQLGPKSVPRQLAEVEGVGTCTHRKCGCFIHSAEVFPNKLSWSTTSCPRKHWGPIK